MENNTKEELVNETHDLFGKDINSAGLESIGSIELREQNAKPINAFRYRFIGEKYNGEHLPETVIEMAEELARNASLSFLKPPKKVDEASIINISVKETFEKGNRLNPKVGAVLLRAKPESNVYDVIGCCRGAFDGDNHAEHSLLNHCYIPKEFKEHDFFFTTLEPCTKNSRNKWSRSCSILLKDRKVKHLFIGLMDPNPLITGYGYFTLFKGIPGIEIRPFIPRIREKLYEDNKEYLRQFDFADFESYRAMALSFDKYIDYKAVDSYVEVKYKGENFKNQVDKYRHFYRDMSMRKYIYKQGEGDIENYIPSNEFALFFFKRPSDIVDGATIHFFPNGKEDRESAMPLDLPLGFFYEGENEACIPGFLERFVLSYGSHGELEEFNGLSPEERKEFIKGFSLKRTGIGIEVFREAVSNAIVHRDYGSGRFTKIIFEEDEVIIENPVKEISLDSLMQFQSFSLTSDPTNPKLMRLFMDIESSERLSYGMQTLKDAHAHYYASDSHTLVLRIPFKNKSKGIGGKNQ